MANSRAAYGLAKSLSSSGTPVKMYLAGRGRAFGRHDAAPVSFNLEWLLCSLDCAVVGKDHVLLDHLAGVDVVESALVADKKMAFAVEVEFDVVVLLVLDGVT